jgi:hypothetical protein
MHCLSGGACMPLFFWVCGHCISVNSVFLRVPSKRLALRIRASLGLNKLYTRGVTFVSSVCFSHCRQRVLHENTRFVARFLI